MVQHLKKLDWLLIFSAFLLVSFGLVSLYSSGGGSDFTNFKKQILWLFTGFFLMTIVSFVDYRILKNQSAPTMLLYVISTFLLAGLFVFGASIRGAENWYRIGPLSIEPVEFVKIAVILVLAKYFSMRHIEMYRIRHILISGLYVFVPVFLMLLQREIGSALVVLGVWLGAMIFAGIKIKHLAGLAIIGSVVFLLSWNFLFADYQKERLLSFFNPRADPQGAGYNVLQAQIAIGSGGFFGKGLGEGTQTQLGFLPEPRTDFIYAAINEEFGFLGAFLLLASFLFFMSRVMKILKNTNNNFARLVSAGFLTMILTHLCVNTGMTLGLLPVTGIPLPFVSYGGSNLISLFTMLGVLQSIEIN